MLFSNLSQFKKSLKPGMKLGCRLIYYNQSPNGELLPVINERPIREISKVQSNSFALKTWNNSRNDFQDSYCDYPKAKNCEVKDNKIIIYEELVGQKLPILEYWIVEK